MHLALVVLDVWMLSPLGYSVSADDGSSLVAFQHASSPDRRVLTNMISDLLVGLLTASALMPNSPRLGLLACGGHWFPALLYEVLTNSPLPLSLEPDTAVQGIVILSRCQGLLTISYSLAMSR